VETKTRHFKTVRVFECKLGLRMTSVGREFISHLIYAIQLRPRIIMHRWCRQQAVWNVV